MTDSDHAPSLEDQIGQWRDYLRRRQAIHTTDVVELEDHLREQISVLSEAGLAADEAFLVAVKRMGDLDTLSREFAREHSDRLWKQLVMPAAESDASHSAARQEAFVAFSLAVAAAILIKLPLLFGIGFDTDDEADFYRRNLALFILPLLASYFIWKRKLDGAIIWGLASAFLVALVLANFHPFSLGRTLDDDTEILIAVHLPIALWLGVGVAYAGTHWNETARRMDFIRFSGEFFIYYVLIALGGALLMLFTITIFSAIGIELGRFYGEWLIPCGAVGGVIVASWLVEAKQSVIENMAPVLTRLFTPFFAAALILFLATVLITGRAIRLEREVLIAFDLLLVIVLGLLLYSVSARDPLKAPTTFDIVQIVLVVAALVADAIALWAILTRIGFFGFTPNRVAALGENLILLVNLAVSAVHYIRFVRGRAPFAALEKWQTDYLPVYAIWAAIVVIIFPAVFAVP